MPSTISRDVVRGGAGRPVLVCPPGGAARIVPERSRISLVVSASRSRCCWRGGVSASSQCGMLMKYSSVVDIGTS